MAELNLAFKSKEEAVSYQDKIIYDYIVRNSGNEDYSEATEPDERAFVSHHLSDFRGASIRWYPFKEDASILEVEGEMGAITGALCDRARKVTVTENSVFRARAIAERYRGRDNLTVIAGDIAQITFEEKFDYIILFGCLEKAAKGSAREADYVRYLELVMEYLKPDGRILLTVNNLYGIQYLCGKREPHTGIPFDGIAGYPEGTWGRGFHRKQLQRILESAGLGSHKFFYPVSDCELPRMIYTDECQPGNNILERLADFYPDNSTLLANDVQIYLDSAQNGCFPFVANIFLVEAGREGMCSDINYAALSVLRGRKKSFATMVSSSGKVWKRCLYPEGVVYAEKLCEEIKALGQRHIPVVDMTLRGDTLEMDYIDAPALQRYVGMLAETKADTGCLIEMFDRLWELILNSSDLSDECAFGEGTDWGPVLKKAYIEMIPLNCFYRDGELLFYDQEFVRENFPARYVMFRALRYAWLFNPGMQEYFPQEELKRRYGISEEMWKICLEKEEEFQAQVDNQPMKWLGKDFRKMLDNRYSLSMTGRTVQRLPRDRALMKRVHEVQMDLLWEFKRVCEKYHLQYYMIYGTLLGAVRHGGVIPWDDDIDVALPRRDYEKLMEVAPEEFSGTYFLQTPWNDKCFHGGYVKLHNTLTTAIVEKNWWVPCCEGISIDIFPLDYGYCNKWKERWKERRIRFYQRLLYAKAYGFFAEFLDMPLLVWKFYKYLGLPFPQSKLADRLNGIMARGDEEEENAPFGVFAHYAFRGGKMKLFRAKDFGETVSLMYDDLVLPAPAGYDEILKKRYGRNYMSAPTDTEGMLRHAFYAVNVPYRNYKKRFAGLFKPEPAADKEIVLFGDDIEIAAWFKRYGKKYRPAYIVHVEGPCEKKEFYGIHTERFEEFQADDINRIYPVICSIYIRNVESRLRRAGYREYYIYIDHREWIRLEDPDFALKAYEEKEDE